MIARARRLPLLEIAAFAAAVACIVTFNLLGQSKKANDVDSYSSYDAAAGGLRAWYELLAREGVRTARFEERSAFLDRSLRALIVADASPLGAFSGGESDAPALAAWVGDGGNLLLAGTGMVALLGRDPLRLPRAKLQGQNTPYVAPSLRAYGVRDVAADDGARFVARRGDTVLLRDRSGVLLLRYALGKGHILALADAAMLRNASIDRPDRARFGYALALLLAPRGAAAVSFDEALHGYVAPVHWWQVLPRRFVFAVLLAVAALLIAIAGAAIRLGPPQRLGLPRAPSSAEYLDAYASLLERRGATDAALREALVATRRRLARRFSLADDVPAVEMAARIDDPVLRAQFLDVTAAALNGANGEPGLVRGVALLTTLRKEYSIDDRGR